MVHAARRAGAEVEVMPGDDNGEISLDAVAAALDERVKVCVDICCLTDFQALIETRGLDGHGIYYYVPGLLKHFTTAQINALICPRALQIQAGNKDGVDHREPGKLLAALLDLGFDLRSEGMNAFKYTTFVRSSSDSLDTAVISLTVKS